MNSLSEAEVYSFVEGDNDVLDLTLQCGCWKGPDHFVLASGKHSPYYFDKDALFADPARFDQICQRLLEKVKSDSSFSRITAIAGPERWGNRMSHNIASIAETGDRPVRLQVVELLKDSTGRYYIPTDQLHLVQGSVFVLIDDVWSAGTTLAQARDLIERNGGIVEIVGVAINRSVEAESWLPSLSAALCFLLRAKFPVWTERDCPLCQKGIKINTKLGHGANVSALVQERQSATSS